MAQKTANYLEPDQIVARTAELGFPLDVLNKTVTVWISGMHSGTDLHAENYAGTIAWHEALATLRLEGLQHDLEKLNREGVQLCVCSKTRVAVMIAQGDSRTGDRDNLRLKPSTKYPRGPRSCEVLEAQLSLFPSEGKIAKTDPYEIWVLLVRMTAQGEARAELSWPSVINTKKNADGETTGTITNWHERIFLGPFDEWETIAQRTPSDMSPTESVQVPLKKRG